MKIEMPIGEIPQSDLDRIKDDLLNYTVPLVGCSGPRDKIAKLAGSGTLLEFGGRKFVLTATHVWEWTSWAEGILFTLGEKPSALTVSRDHFNPKTLPWEGASEFGPDMTLLELPEAAAADIAARKSFVNFALQRENFHSFSIPSSDGIWVVIGAVGEESRIVEHLEANISTAEIRGNAFFGSVDTMFSRSGYDYIDVGANLMLPGVPQSFGGLSGGGLWQVPLAMHKSTSEIYLPIRPLLRGVAFWQTPPAGDKRTIRCHGPKSIYETAYREWKFDA
jgi:hypothetical protein